MSSRNYDITGYGINLKDLEEHFNTEAIDEVLASSDDSDDDFDAHLTYLSCRHEVLSFTISAGSSCKSASMVHTNSPRA